VLAFAAPGIVRAGMTERDAVIVARSDRRAAAAAWHGLLQEQPSSAHAALGESCLPVVLVLGSRNDTTAEVERFRDVVPQVDVRTIESGHDLLADAPAETIAVVANGCKRPSKLARMSSRRFSQAISEGDGISVIVDVADVEAAQAAAAQGAEALAVRTAVVGLRSATELPVLWRAPGPPSEAARAGADAWLVVVSDAGEDDEWLARQHAEAVQLGLDCVVEVTNEEELELALERLDAEIFLLTPGDEGNGDELAHALELLPDIPAGKLAVAAVPGPSREQVDELERAGVDAVIVGARNVSELVGDAPPPV
jgi:indole-3-glycerol phosphate synthase